MPSFGPNFINVETETGFLPAAGRNFTSRLRSMVEVNPSQPFAERTLWFPPGRYSVTAPFRFPPEVILSFAPGALLVPFSGTSPGGIDVTQFVEIAGVIDAPVAQIFSTTPSSRIVFVGDGTPRVHPEWWGAAQNRISPGARARADTAAIQAAFQAAVVDRETGAAPTPTPIAVCLLNDYYIDEPIIVAPRPGARPLTAVVIVATPGQKLIGQAMSPPFPPALLEIRRSLSVNVRDLSLVANGSWETCLSVSCDVSRDRLPHQVTLVDCSFNGARSAQASISDLAVTPPLTGELKALVRGCRFAVDDARHTDFELPPLDEPSERPEPLLGQFLSKADGLSVQASFGAELAVEGGEFTGFLRRGIHTIGGVRSVVLGCSFRFQDRSDNVFPNGAAVALDRAGVRQALLPSLQAMSCVATTPSFLWVDAPSRGDWDKSPETIKRGISAVLTGISHRVDHSRGLALYWPPSVVWRGERPMDQANVPGNSTLTLIGCSFEVPSATPPTTPTSLKAKLRDLDQQALGNLGWLPRIPRVFINSDLSWVYNLGTFRVDWPMPVIGTFEQTPHTETRSLHHIRATGGVAGPVITPMREWVLRHGRLHLLFAWADWAGAPILAGEAVRP